MKNYKRILAAIGTAALLVSNVGAVSQVVFADEADIVESVQDNVVDVTQDDVTAQVQEIIDNALATTAEDTETQEAADTESTPAESVGENAASESTETTPAEDVNGSEDATAASTEAAGTDESTTEETSGEEQKSDETTGDETAATGTTEAADSTTGSEDVIEEIVIDEPTIEGTTEDLIDEAAAADTTEEETAEETEAEAEVVEEETEEDELISDPYEATVTVDGESGITVKATAKENILPENAVLVASMITKENDEDAYNKVEEALIESDNVDYTVEDAIAAETDTQAVDNDSDDETAEEATPGAGFIAMDIRFEVTDDETGETDEIEPKGAVNITFDIAENVLPVEADPETLTVHHLVEDEDGNVDRVETVADTDDSVDSEIDGLVQAAEAPDENTSPEVNAEFEVESLSPFVIEWDSNQYDERVHINYIAEVTDENGNVTYEDISNKVQNVDIVEDNDEDIKLDLRYFAKDIPGYTFIGIKGAGRGKDDSEIKYPDDRFVDVQFVSWKGASLIDSHEKLRYWTFDVVDGEDNDEVKYVPAGEFDDDGDIYIVYKKGRGAGSEEDYVSPSVDGSKTLTNNEDGTYNLSLDVTSSNKTRKDKVKIDVLFVLDCSSSMVKNDVTKTLSDGSKTTVLRAVAAEDAIVAASDAIAAKVNSGDVDARYGLVKFSTYAPITGEWSTINFRTEKITKADLPSTNHTKNNDHCGFKGDTNYEAAFIATRQAMEWARSDAKKVVIFLTDGVPTRAYGTNDHNYGSVFKPNYKNEEDGRLDGNGGERTFRTKAGQNIQSTETKLGFLNRATKELASCGLNLNGGTEDLFYVVGLGVKDEKDDWPYTGEKDRYNKFVLPLANSSYFEDGVTVKGQKIDDDADKLSELFEDIVAESMTIDAQDVTLQDPLSQYAEIVDENDLTVTVTKADGTAYADADTQKDGFQIQQSVTETVTDGTTGEAQEVTRTYTYTVKPEVVTSGEQKTIQMTFVPDGSNPDPSRAYHLESGWTYRVSTRIRPTESAYNMFSTSAEQCTDKGAGKYAGQTGLYTNGYTDANGNRVDAAVTYKYTKVDGTLSNLTTYSYEDKPVWTSDILNNKIVKTGVVTDNNMFPALVATIDIMAAMFVVYGIAKRRVR